MPAPQEWVPLLGMSLVVGLFEAVYFRGFVQGRLESSFGAAPAVAGAAALYAVYHVGYGMDASQMWFLFALGVVYTVAYRLTRNVLVIWPLLTPMGGFFTNLRAGDIDLPWASLLGFADVAVLMVAAIWLAHRHERRASRPRTL
jgi:membrane protease YdiL (CAAX protease family)